MQLRLFNTEGIGVRNVTKATVTITGVGNIAPGSLRLIQDFDGDLSTDDSGFQILTDTSNLTGNQAYFDPSPDLNLSNNTTCWLFVVYNSSVNQTDNATIDAEISSTADIAVSTTVSFLTGTPLNSSGQDTVSVVATSYTVSAISNQAAGVAFSATVTAVDAYGNTDLDATTETRIGTASVSGAGTSPGGVAPVYPGPASLTSGQRTFSGITLYSATSTVRLGASYVSGSPNLSGAGTIDSNAFAVAHSTPLFHIGTISSPRTAGAAFNVTVDASSDTYGNLIDPSALSGKQVAVNGNTANGPTASPLGNTPVYGATQTFNGASPVLVATIAVTLYDMATGVQLHADNPSGIITSTDSAQFNVDAAATSAFLMDTIVSTPIAGVAFDITVRGSDQYGNTGGSISGVDMIIAGAGDSSAPGNAPNGTSPSYPGTFSWTGQTSRTESVTLYSQQTERRLKARSNPEGSVATSTSNYFNVWASTANNVHFEFYNAAEGNVGNMTAGVVYQATVTVRDNFRNIIASPNFATWATGTPKVSVNSTASNGPLGQAPVYEATHTWVSGNSGQTLMDVTLYRQENTLTLVANDPSGTVAASTQSVAFNVLHGTAAALSIDAVASTTAGTAFNVFVRISSDTHGNAGIPPANYSGAGVRVSSATGSEPGSSSSDGVQASSSPTYGPAQIWGSGPVDVATFSVTLVKAESNRRLAAAETGTSTGKLGTALSNTFSVSNTVTQHLHTDAPASVTAGVAFTSTVTVHDQFNNAVLNFGSTIHFTVMPSSSGNSVPADVTSAPDGQAAASFTLVTVGVSSVSASDLSSPSTLTSTDTLTVLLGSALMKLQVSTSAVAGTAFGSTVTVADAFGNLFTTYNGTVTFASGDGAFAPPFVSTTVPGGTGFFSGFVLKTAGDQTFSASDNVGTTSTSTVIAVALSANRFVRMVLASTATAGVDLAPALSVTDDYDNVFTAFTGTVRLTSGDSAALLPADTALDAGKKTVSLILKTSGDQTVTATDLSGLAAAVTKTVTVAAPSEPAKFGFTLPTSITAGEAFTFVIEARDAFGNRTNYTGPGTLKLASGRFEVLSENAGAPSAVPLVSATDSTTINFVSGLWSGRVVLRGEAVSPVFSVSVGSVTQDTSDMDLLVALPYLEDTITYPSPYRPSRDGNMNIRFHAPNGGSLRVAIFAFDGSLVREWDFAEGELGTDVLKRLTWDGKDSSGNDVADGVYLCVTEVAGVNKPKRVKFGLVR
jgi:hypothetical protein